MTAAALILVLLVAGLASWPTVRLGRRWPRIISLLGLGLDLAIVIALWSQARNAPGWLDELRLLWVPELGMTVHLAVDGLSLLLVGLTCVVGIVAVLASWREIDRRSGRFHALLLWSLAGIVGVFVSLDLILFYFFWEIMLVPTYYLYVWGHDRQLRAALKFFVFTQLSGLLMLLAIVGLALSAAPAAGGLTFDYAALLANRPTGGLATWLFLGFWVAFAVKLPLLPFHTWQPDAYYTAPTGVSIVLAGAMAKTAGYGLLRFALPLFPQAAAELAPYLLVLSALSILYAAWTAFGQTDFKRLVAYSSMASMGFVMLGVLSRQGLAWQGVTMQMVAHGLSTSALFFVAGALYARLGGTDFARMGGLWATAPRLGALTMFFAVATLGLPGLGNFVGEFLVLLGTFRAHQLAAALATLGLVLATVYALWLVQRAFQGALAPGVEISDARGRELLALGLLVVGLLWLGLFPQSLLDLATPALNGLGGPAGLVLGGGR